MATYDIWVLGESNLTISGGAQLDGVTQGDGSHLVGQTITLDNRDWSPISINDVDTTFSDNGPGQTLDGAQTVNGTYYAGGTPVEAEYSLTLSDGTTTYQVVGFNVTDSAPAYATVEGLAFVGPPGSWPPQGVPLTVIAAQEGPSFLAADYVEPICFAAGTLIETPSGPRAVERLRPGDPVSTHDGRAVVLRWQGIRRYRPAAGDGPIRFRAGALGNARDLVVSPQHRLYLSDWRAELLFGVDGVLVAAKDFVDGVRVVRERVDVVTYVHLMFDRHEIILSEGIPTESLYPGPRALENLPDATRDELMAIFPELACGVSYGTAAAPLLKSYEARALFAA